MGRKKSNSRRKRIYSVNIQPKSLKEGSESTPNFASNPTLSSRKPNFQTDDWSPIPPNPNITSTLCTNKKDLPKLPTLSKSTQELGSIDAESILTSNRKVASCEDLPLTSTLSPLPRPRSRSVEFRKLETYALRMDRCRSLRLDDILFKDSVPRVGRNLQDETAKVLNSLHPKTASSFRNKMHELSRAIDHSIRVYNSACRMAAVRADMFTSMESLLTEKVSRQRSQIKHLAYTVVVTSDCASATFEKRRKELDQKNEIIRTLEEEIRILKADRFREQSSKFNGKDKTVILDKEDKSSEVDIFGKLYPELEDKDKTIQHFKEVNSLKVQMDREKTSESQQNLETEVFSTSCENSTAEQKTESEIELEEFNQILELGKFVSENLLIIQKAKEKRSLQNETKHLKVAIGDQKISQQGILVELDSLKYQNASLTKQLHSKNGLISSLQENMAPKENMAQLKIQISNNETCSLLENPRHSGDIECEMDAQRINLFENIETRQVLQKTEKLSSQHFPLNKRNKGKGSLESDSTFLKNVPLNPKWDACSANSLEEDFQDLLHVMKEQQLSFQQHETYVRKLALEISSIQLQNKSMLERLSQNESKLASLTSSKMTSPFISK